MIAQHLVLHLVPDGVRPKIYLSQNDTGFEKLKFDLVEESTYYEIPSGSSVIFVGMKSDKKMFSYACTYSGHEVTCDVTEQMTSVPGCVVCELRILSIDGDVLGSINVDLVIERSPLHYGICSCNDFKSVDDEITSIHQEVQQAKDFANGAEDAKDQAGIYLGAAQTASDQAITEMWQAVDSIHGLIENGLVINYYEEPKVLEFVY